MFDIVTDSHTVGRVIRCNGRGVGWTKDTGASSQTLTVDTGNQKWQNRGSGLLKFALMSLICNCDMRKMSFVSHCDTKDCDTKDKMRC